jgi:hypothetical protein
MPSSSSLSLNRKLQNSLFESWKLGSDFVQSRSCLQLPGQVYQGAGDAVDFLHTKASVLRNHLIESQGRRFVATISDDQSLVLNEVEASETEGVQLLPLAGGVACCCCYCCYCCCCCCCLVVTATAFPVNVPYSHQRCNVILAAIPNGLLAASCRDPCCPT